MERFYSQFGEDKKLARIFRGKTDGACVEVGAHDGVRSSNTCYFERKGWRSVLVEPNPELSAAIRSNRTAQLFECAASDHLGDAIFYSVHASSGHSTLETSSHHFERVRNEGGAYSELRVRTRPLDLILEEAGVGPVDFISIDVEGHELAVLRGLDLERWKPRVLIVEDNTEFRDRSVPRHLRRCGYRRFFRTGCNHWYARAEDRELVTLPSRALVGAWFVAARVLARFPALAAWLRRWKIRAERRFGGRLW